MSRARILRSSALFVAGATATVAVAPSPFRSAWAESPAQDDLPVKKPIYSSPRHTPQAALDSKPPGTITDPLSQKPLPPHEHPTPTDRLAVQIGHARVFLHDQAESAENAVNSGLNWLFRKETNIANTIASLAPAPETGEQLLPGAIYVLVATMAGSIVARNRGIFVRATFPLAVGITAGWYLIPVTMRNVGDLAWEYEKKVPGVSETHAQIAGFARAAYKQIREGSQDTVQWADKEAGKARRKVEQFVGEGR